MEISKNNILVKTTLKNNFSLMKPFYKFYIGREIWTIIDVTWAILLLSPYLNKLSKL